MKETKYVIVTEENEDITAPITEQDILATVNEERFWYIKDEVDPDYIEENFPEEIKDIPTARKWLEGMGSTLCEVPDKLNTTQRIFKRMYEKNEKIKGTIRRKEKDYFDQGTWNFSIKILDIDENNCVKFQLSADKICPSGGWDNGISVSYHPYMSLYELKNDLDTSIKYIIDKFFKSDRNICGECYRLERYSL